jgi:DNA-binding XRE family transcriptional regulator
LTDNFLARRYALAMPLKQILKDLRLGISPSAATIGALPRPPNRQGRPVTQEEMAEYLGVSREWYVRLETRENVRTSIDFLQRFADLFVLSNQQRVMLLLAALPVRHGVNGDL